VPSRPRRGVHAFPGFGADVASRQDLASAAPAPSSTLCIAAAPAEPVTSRNTSTTLASILDDYCLINDGGVAIIVRRADMAHDLRHRPITVSGFGWSEENVDATQLRPRLKDFYHTAHRDVAAQVYPMAG
jgi:hypothetical protein